MIGDSPSLTHSMWDNSVTVTQKRVHLYIYIEILLYVPLARESLEGSMNSTFDIYSDPLMRLLKSFASSVNRSSHDPPLDLCYFHLTLSGPKPLTLMIDLRTLWFNYFRFECEPQVLKKFVFWIFDWSERSRKFTFSCRSLRYVQKMCGCIFDVI